MIIYLGAFDKGLSDIDLDGIYIQKNHLESLDKQTKLCFKYLDGKLKFIN